MTDPFSDFPAKPGETHPARASRNPAGSPVMRDVMPGVALPAKPPMGIRQLVLWLVVCGFGLFGGLVFWAFQAEVTSAVVAPGQFSVDGKRLNVQHLEGGIVRDILVKEGERVLAGQVVARLDGSQTDITLSILKSQLAGQLVQEARLAAELSRSGPPEKTPELQALFADAPELAGLFDVQIELYENNMNLFEGQIRILNERVAQLRDRRDGRNQQLEAMDRQVSLLREEIRNQETLYEKGLVPKARLTQGKMQEANLTGTLGYMTSDRDHYDQRISEVQETILQTERDRQRNLVAAMRLVQEDSLQLRQQIAAFEDIRSRLQIRAPEAGRVVALSINTIGQVLEPGANVLELVPSETDLVLATRVSPSDIDEVFPGSTARVQLTAYSFRTTPPVNGEVTLVGADSLLDQATGQPYFEVRISISEAELAALPNVRALPGMPGQAMIETGRHSLANYLLDPILTGMSMAMREGRS